LPSKLTISNRDALIVVDVQNDFCPTGALPVDQGDQIVPTLNKYIDKFRRAEASIFATRDWHPQNHISFRQFGGPWPPHCVQGTRGAEFHPDLELPIDVTVISKATDPSKESYSGFDGTQLEQDLKRRRTRRIFVGGLATDYCVKRTVLDGLGAGFEAFLLVDATKGINNKPNDSEEAIGEMIRNGAQMTTIAEMS
jgi:nicotinamidase/pyrazinamidase